MHKTLFFPSNVLKCGVLKSVMFFQIQSLYEHCQGEVYEVMEPETAEREAFFEQLFFPTESTTSIPENLSQKSSSGIYSPFTNHKNFI